MLKIVSIALAVSLACGSSPGRAVRDFTPEGTYGGHWGVDYAMDPDSEVHAIADGVVTFAGTVAGMKSVTIAHRDGLRTSYSYLRSVNVEIGRAVAGGDVIGTSGVDHGLEALHFSARMNGHYVDPSIVHSCDRGEVHLIPIP
jgi:murein DD-endopeptidase MepM/ murein hydrolase activator NlpD